MTTYDRVDLSEYIVISVWFGCNNHCTICMLSGLKKKLPAIGFERFKKVLVDIANDGRFEKLILSGAEVTTFDDLDRYIQFAASLGWFKKIQIQTNGRRLQDKAYINRLTGCGLNEFFISIYGLEKVHDAITGVRGSFKETMEGFKNLEDFDVNVISNTVLTKDNLRDIPRLMASLSRKSISEIHLWNFFPMETTDSRDLVVSIKDLLETLPEVLSILRPAGKPLVLKSFPECLSVGESAFIDSGFPVTILPDIFWREFSRNKFGLCVHRNACAAEACWGLSSAYIEKYGDEKHLLSPFIK